MLGSQRGQPLALIQGDHCIPPLGEREGHLSCATSDLEDPAMDRERRKGNDVLDNLFRIARPYLVIELCRIIELPG
jgi:hypothetical protein